MIRIACPGCGSILNAKDELAGQTRKCPKCGGKVSIPLMPTSQALPSTASDAGEDASATSMPAVEQPSATEATPVLRRLERRNRYLICNKTHVLAQWENNGQGWMLKTRAGTASVARHRDQLPKQGEFRLVEMKLDDTEAGYRLTNIAVYRLAAFGALLKLCRGDDAILTSIVEPSSLNKAQRHSVWESLRQQLIPEIWERSAEVLKYLSNSGDHTAGSA